MIPQCIAVGISYEDFWKLNPRKLNVILDGYKLKRKTRDEEAWIMGGYMFSAVTAALGNAFRKKNQKAKSYFEIVDKPFLSEIEREGEISEEEKKKRLDALMASLHVMKTNFDLNHGK